MYSIAFKGMHLNAVNIQMGPLPVSIIVVKCKAVIRIMYVWHMNVHNTIIVHHSYC